jgi:hypothetical protein
LVQSGAMRTMAKPPSPERIRLTISVSPEVHAAFQRMADVSGMSIGRAMGDWLADTLEGAEMVTAQLERARQAPRQVAADMRQQLLGSVDLMDEVLQGMRTGHKGAAGAGRGSAAVPGAEAATPSPRPVIRGGKSPRKTLSKGKGKGNPRADEYVRLAAKLPRGTDHDFDFHGGDE